MPPTIPPFRFEVVFAHRLLVEIRGVLDDRLIDDLMRNAVEALASTSEIKQVLVDIRSLDDCSVSARTGLVSLQKLLARRRLRTAWVASTPRMQGLARVIILGVGDQSAATFITTEQADAWFGETTGRFDGVMRNLRRSP